MSQADESSPHRLFAAIVLMGTGLTLGCGGIAERESTNGSSGSPAAGGTGGSPAGGNAPSFGGSDLIVVTGGGAGSAPVTPGPFECPPQRWDCADPTCGLVDNGWALPDDCKCDPLRPEKASDCGAGKVFLCRSGTSTSDGRALAAKVPFDCRCVDKAMYFCQNECDQAYGLRNASCYGNEQETSAECGCAIVYLK